MPATNIDIPFDTHHRLRVNRFEGNTVIVVQAQTAIGKWESFSRISLTKTQVADLIYALKIFRGGQGNAER